MDGDSGGEARAMLARAVEFHGHLGPFLVLGIRMGVIARSMLKPQHHGDLAVIVFVNPKPPASCAVDGVQVSSGCTLGKATIQVSESAKGLVGEFHAGDRTCTVTVEPNLLSGLLEGLRNATEKEVAEMAESVLVRPDDELFHITKPT